MENNWKRNSAVFLASQGISLFGSALVQYAIMWHITLTTQSGFYTTIAIVCGFVPTLLLSPFAGVWADRFNRKTLIMLADGGIALATLALAIIYLAGYREMWLLFAVMAVRAFGGAVQNPCVNAMLPDIVPTEHLTRINGLNSSIQSALQLVAPMASGALMGFVGLEYIFFIDVVTAAIAILIMLFFLKVEYHPRAQTQGSADYFNELKEGLAYIGRLPWLRNFFIILAFFFITISPISFLPALQVARNYGDDVWRLTAMEVCFAGGMIVGGLVIAAWGGLKNRVATMALFAGAMGALCLFFAFPLRFVLYCVVMALVGVTLPMVNTPAIVMLQEKVAPEYIGRVFSIMSMISSSLMPLAMLIFGPLADAVAIEWLMLYASLAVIVLAFVMVGNRALRQEGVIGLEDE